jgi:hypothetical protein
MKHFRCLAPLGVPKGILSVLREEYNSKIEFSNIFYQQALLAVNCSKT